MKTKTTKIAPPTGKMIVRSGDNAYVTAFINGESLTVRAADSPVPFQKALEAIKSEDWDALYAALRPVKAAAQSLKGVTVDRNGVYFNGEPIANTVADRILEFVAEGLDYKPLSKFLEKLLQNPSMRAVKELYTFLEHKNIPITENGNILAYKGVKSDFYSISSGTAKLLKGKLNASGQIYNGVGEEIEMLRNEVDDNKDRGCSYGLHAGTLEYATDFGRNGKVVIVEINPKDVVSIPTDCQFQKMRTSAYKVVGEYEGPLDKPVYESRWSEADDSYEDDNLVDLEDYDGDVACECDVNGEVCCKAVYPVTEVIAFNTPDSSWMSRVAWYDNGNLAIVKDDDDVIEYEDVEEDVAREFADFVNDGGSAGVFYNRHIKGQYDTV
jgi:hypothetical protein